MYADDTIAAIATPPGPGGIGIVRVSGPAAEAIGNRVFLRHRGGAWDTHRLYHGHLLDADGRPIDDALAVLMRAPRSYTGEDVLELHCHGSPVLMRRALETVLGHGARPAAAGEFTKRAYLNGKLDLAQAEAVIDLVRAGTADSARQAADQLFGRLSSHLADLRRRLLRVLAHLEAQIDFADEDLGLDPSAAAAAIDATAQALEALLRSYERGRLLRDGIRVAITGPPNAGKSSLLNALLGEDRAIVTAVPGTTRDVIEEGADFDGVPVLLSDTAGLRDAPGEVERIGVERAHAVAAAADVVLVVLDASLPPERSLTALDGARTIVVLNKIDLPCVWSDQEIQNAGRGLALVRISAKEKLGLDALRRAVLAHVGCIASDGVPTLSRARQRDALAKARRSLQRAGAALGRNTPPELIAVDVQAALDHIGEVTGVVTTEDVLDVIFAEFCIGK